MDDRASGSGTTLPAERLSATFRHRSRNDEGDGSKATTRARFSVIFAAISE